MLRKPALLACFVLLVGCLSDRQAPEPPDATCCWRCDRVWTAAELAVHEEHRVERNLMMFASGCEYCRYHGAYKDVEFSTGR